MKRKTLLAAIVTATVAFTSCTKTYEIGDDGPGGGIVFYYSEEGFQVRKSDKARPVTCHYLECSPVELRSITWCSCEDEMCDVDTQKGIGAGKLNTVHIVNYRHEQTLTSGNCAAKVCLKYSTSTTKKGDWYLPSKDELNLIYKNLVKPGIIKGDDYYWSSSQYDDAAAWQQNFNDGDRNNYDKDDDVCVRAVRAF